MKSLHLLEFLAEAFRSHVHHYQCLVVPVELAVMFVFRFSVVGIAEMLVLLACAILSMCVWVLQCKCSFSMLVAECYNVCISTNNKTVLFYRMNWTRSRCWSSQLYLVFFFVFVSGPHNRINIKKFEKSKKQFHSSWYSQTSKRCLTQEKKPECLYRYKTEHIYLKSHCNTYFCSFIDFSPYTIITNQIWLKSVHPFLIFKWCN